MCAGRVWKFAAKLLVISVATVYLIQGSQNSLTTTESPTHSLKVNQGRKNESDPCSRDPCSRNRQCCKLGRKAARKSYTCQFEALSKSLEYQTALSYRLRPARAASDRMKAAFSFHNHARALRRRLYRCRQPLNKKCFQYCCKAVSEKLLRRDTLGTKRASGDSSKSRNITNSRQAVKGQKLKELS